MKILLIIAYVSMAGEPRIDVHPRADMSECRREATMVYNKVRAGSVRAWCVKVPA